MKNNTVFIWCRKIHRCLVLITTFTGILMGGTGYMMHEKIFILLPAGNIRSIHDNFSILFTLVLGTMTLTGVYLFLFPYLKTPSKPKLPN